MQAIKYVYTYMYMHYSKLYMVSGFDVLTAGGVNLAATIMHTIVACDTLDKWCIEFFLRRVLIVLI